MFRYELAGRCLITRVRSRLPQPPTATLGHLDLGRKRAETGINFHHHEGTAMTQWRRKTADETYSPEEIEARLKAELPHWYYEDGWIRRKYKTSGWKATLMVVNTVGHLAEAAWHHPDLTVSYAFVIVKLMNHAAKGVTEKDFALARKIEEVIQWQPGREEGTALEGTPDDPRFKYLKYDAR